jgi:hypothetical protein
MENKAENLKVTAPAMKTQAEWFPKPFIDNSDPNNVYIGLAPLSVQESDMGWQICLKQTVDGVIKHLYPQGSMGFEFVWEDRATYTYGR